MDKYIAGVSLLEQKVHQLSAELEKERENVRIMYDDNVNNQQIFVIVAGWLIGLSTLYRDFMRCRSVETWACFEKNMESTFKEVDYSWIRPFVLSHHPANASKHSAMPTPAKSGLPIKAALAVAKKSKEIKESSKF